MEEENAATNAQEAPERVQLSQESDDPFNVDDEEFLEEYRITKELARNLCEEIRPLMKAPKKSTDLSVEKKLLIALSFYVSGIKFSSIGSTDGQYMVPQKITSIVKQVTMCLISPTMQQKYIKFPRNEEERNAVQKRFFDRFGIPGILGCVACTKIVIKRPWDWERYVINDSSKYYLNVQVVCDADMQIMSIDATHGAATDDADIWDRHPIKKQLESLGNTWVLGNSLYTLNKNTMTPMPDPRYDFLHNTPNLTKAEMYYNDKLYNARRYVQTTIDHLRSRYGCLQRKLHYTPEFYCNIVNACAVLHNICNKAQVPMEYVDDYTDENMEYRFDFHQRYKVLNQEGLDTRNCLVELLWEMKQEKLRTQSSNLEQNFGIKQPNIGQNSDLVKESDIKRAKIDKRNDDKDKSDYEKAMIRDSSEDFYEKRHQENVSDISKGNYVMQERVKQNRDTDHNYSNLTYYDSEAAAQAGVEARNAVIKELWERRHEGSPEME